MPSFSRTSGSHGCSGQPVVAVSGKLWYSAADATLSGPFGIQLGHRYDSDEATYQGDLGVGWRHSYGDYLDVSHTADAIANYHSGSCSRGYFQYNGPGTASYDSYSGDTLAANSDGSYTLTKWSGETLAFDSSGRLTSEIDRVGNVQTLARDSSHRISSITDPLGRSVSFTYDSSNRIQTVSSSPSQVSMTLAYDSGTNCYTGDLCSVTESDGSVWSYQYYNPASYGGNHLLEKVIDPLSHVEEYNKYSLVTMNSPGDTHYRVTHQEQDSGQNARDYSYSDNATFNGTTTITDALGSGHTTVYTWDSLTQEVVGVSGPLCSCAGNTLAYTYDTFNRQQSQTEGSGTGTRTATYAYGRDVIFTSPDGATSYVQEAYPGPTQSTQYNIRTTTGPQNRLTGLQYYPLTDARRDLLEVITEPSVDTPGSSVTTTLTYSAQGQLTSLARTGFVGGTSTTHSSSASYDSRGRVQTVTGPRTDVSQTTSYAYYPDTDSDLNRRGQLDTVTDALSHVTTFASAASPYNSYTLYGGPKSVSDQNGVVHELSYDARGRLTTSVLLGVTGDPANLTTSFSYDAAGRATGTVRPLLNGSSFAYDTNNNATAIVRVDASGLQHEQSSLAYDVMSRLTTTALQSCTTPAASCSAWTTAYSSTQTLSGLDQLSSLSWGTAGASNYTYDAFGNLSALQNGTTGYSYTKSWVYGQNHDVLSDRLGNGDAALSYAYDLQLNKTRFIPAGGGAPATIDSFDDFGRIRKSASPYAGTTTFTYDPAGNMLTRVDGNAATTTVAYDALNRPTSSSSVRSGKTTETVSWTYDNATSGHFGIGRLASMTDPSGSTTYAYERRGLIASTSQVVSGTTYPTSYSYDGNGNRATISLPSGRTLTYTYDFADRPYSVVSGTTTYVSSTSYAPFGPLASIQFGNGTTQMRSYNTRYLPTELKLSAGSTTLADQVYTENGASFVTAIADSVNAAYSRAFAYGGRATNMLTTATTGSALWQNAQYADGNNQNISSLQIPGNDYGLTYNRQQQLTSIYNADAGTSQAVTLDAVGNELSIGTASYSYSTRNLLASGDGITYTYNGFGARTTATASAGTRVSLYDPQGHLQSESALSSGSIAYDYIWLGSIPVAQEDVGGQTHWTVTDHLGTAVIQTNSSGAIYWQADYSPTGAVYALRTSDAHQPLRMPGQEAEEFTVGNPNGLSGRFYNHARWYRPQYGRYTQSDPLGYESTYSLYGYGANNTPNFTDPSGLNGLGISLGGQYEIGFGPLQAAGSEAAGGTVFYDTSNGTVSVGGQIGADGFVTANGNPVGGLPSASGAAVGAGINLNYTNANNQGELDSVSTVNQFDIGLGALQFSMAIGLGTSSSGAPIYSVSVGLPYLGLSLGAGGASYSTSNLNSSFSRSTPEFGIPGLNAPSSAPSIPPPPMFGPPGSPFSQFSPVSFNGGCRN